ncbi:acyltransferase family protein [Mucilaginibacter calamicampi]|uniref:Acyltransferase family protein n=1 Tax=Mucilaginibacter calamicampi TaxID=1302352 RepID=A0ABW2YTP9_9SPHI
MSHTKQLNFRYDINALRAIAVIGVLLFHYKVPYLDGGFAGVDVFFVISGYLMSKIIINGLHRDNFSILEFYGRRFKRIVPALLGLVLGLTIVGFFIYFPVNYQVNEQNAAASILFISNLVYWKSAGYFADASDTNILLHTWSLSVEWQFYIIYPIILLLVNQFIKSKAQYIYAFIAVTLAGYAVAIWYTTVDKDGSFFLLHSRAWEMMLGGLAFLCEDMAQKIKLLIRQIIAIAGYLAIFLCFYLLKSSMDWPGGYTIIPVFAAFLIIAANCGFKALRFGVVQFTGKISYSLYLWHWPVYVIAQYLGFSLNPTTVISLTAISFVLGYLSFKYIESFNYSGNRPILVGALVLLIVTGSFSYFEVNKIAFKHDALMVAGYIKRHPYDTRIDSRGCFLTTKHKVIGEFNEAACLSISPAGKNFLLIGDSHSADLSEAFRARFKDQNINIMVATASGCSPFIDQKKGKRLCRELMNYTFKVFVAKNADKIDGVIISANWVNRGKRSVLQKDLDSTLAYLKTFNINTILIGQNEIYSVTYPVLKAKELQFNKKLTDVYVNKDCYNVNNFMKQKFKPYYIEIINKTTLPALGTDYGPYMFDKDHFTPYGAGLAITKILANPIAKRFFN